MVSDRWENVTLAQVGTFKKGSGISRTESNSGNLAAVRYGELYTLHNYYIRVYNSHISRTVAEKALRVYYGDILFACSGETKEEIAKCAAIIDDVEVYAGGDIIVLTPCMKVNPVFLGFILNTQTVIQQRMQRAQGDAVVHISSESLKTIEISLPKYSEQCKIAAALLDIDTLIVNLENLIEKKKAIKRGVMQELLTGRKRLKGFNDTWIEAKLGDISTITMGQSPASQYYNNLKGLPLIQGNADIENRKTIIRFRTEQCTKMAERGDIIFTVRAPVGTVARATSDCCLGRGVCSIRYENDFLYYYLEFIENTWSSVSTGSTFDSINSTELNKFTIKLPISLREQQAIAEILSDMDTEIEALIQKLEKSRQIKQGMMQELLTGRIRLLETATQKQKKVKAKKVPKAETEQQGHNEHFHEAVILSTVVSLFASAQFPLGRFRRQKFAYLLHRHAQESTQGFLKKAAGPYNPTIRYKDEKIALKAGYVVELGKGKFVQGEKSNEAVAYFVQWYDEDAIEWIKQFQYRKNDDLEVLTTVAEAIVDLKKSNLAITVESVKQVIRENPEWRAKLDKDCFSDFKIQSAIKESQKLFG